MRISIIILIGMIGFLETSWAQNPGGFLGDETDLYAKTKQVNQFFRRFNGEESDTGERYYEKDPFYRNASLREQYINILFDLNNHAIPSSLKQSFIRDVTKKEGPKFLDFHGGKWFAEVQAKFIYMGRPETITLYMNLEEAEVGSKWVFHQVYCDRYEEFFRNDTPPDQKFLHPLSHELDFMNLIRVFRDRSNIEVYTAKDHRPDHLTLFMYEIKKASLRFETVQNVKFHFLQVDDWYFELSQFNRPGKNTGWLISQLAKVTEEEQETLLKYLYHE